MMKTSSNKRYLILGASGFLGGALFKEMSLRGFNVKGTARHISMTGYLPLDTCNEQDVGSFRWNDFDVIIDCTGSIRYENSGEAALQNIKGNVVGPLSVISQLKHSQQYLYCSTHAVLLPTHLHNTYSLSKLFFEHLVKSLRDNPVPVTLVRTPALYSDQRTTGLLRLVRDAFRQRKALPIDAIPDKWHTMYLSRAVDMIISLLEKGSLPQIITLGYRTATSIEAILQVAEQVFGYAVRVKLKKKNTKRYVPKVSSIAFATREDFKRDLEKFFKSS